LAGIVERLDARAGGWERKRKRIGVGDVIGLPSSGKVGLDYTAKVR